VRYFLLIKKREKREKNTTNCLVSGEKRVSAMFVFMIPVSIRIPMFDQVFMGQIKSSGVANYRRLHCIKNIRQLLN